MDRKYLIFEKQPAQGQLETVAEQLEHNSLVDKIRKTDCGLIITYAGSYDEFLQELGKLPENISVEPLGTKKN